jgi:CubicO group peptidase (beta-lactamase class C family)
VRSSLNTSFSVAKSITSLLVGIAIEEGLIGSVDDPMTAYIPELAERDPRFSAITLRHLLDMKSGIRFSDHEFVTGDRSRAYYHPNLRHVVLEELSIADRPGERWVYNTYNPILLGVVLERASGGTVASFLETRVWRQLGMEYPGSWSVDGTVDPLEKMESGINGRAVDFLKIGRLVLRDGGWQGRQIVSDRWIHASTTIVDDCMVPEYPSPRDVCYKLAWWLTPQTNGRRFAVGAWGHRGQYLYVFPEDEIVIVRFGKKLGGVRWPAVFQAIVATISEGQETAAAGAARE